MATANANPQTAGQWYRAVGNVANLSTPIGVLVSILGRARLRRGPRGLLLAEGYRLPFPVAGAFTIGNVIITKHSWAALTQRFPELAAHEERHTWQYLYCGGLPYYLAYTACTGWSMIRTGDRASANFFERQAGLAAGGYTERPRLGIRAGVAAQMSILRSMPSRLADRFR